MLECVVIRNFGAIVLVAVALLERNVLHFGFALHKEPVFPKRKLDSTIMWHLCDCLY